MTWLVGADQRPDGSVLLGANGSLKGLTEKDRERGREREREREKEHQCNTDTKHSNKP